MRSSQQRRRGARQHTLDGKLSVAAWLACMIPCALWLSGKAALGGQDATPLVSVELRVQGTVDSAQPYTIVRLADTGAVTCSITRPSPGDGASSTTELSSTLPQWQAKALLAECRSFVDDDAPSGRSAHVEPVFDSLCWIITGTFADGESRSSLVYGKAGPARHLLLCSALTGAAVSDGSVGVLRSK